MHDNNILAPLESSSTTESCSCTFVEQYNKKDQLKMLSIFLKLQYFQCILPTVTCQGLSLGNGRVNYNKSPVNGAYPVHTTASFQCNVGYYLQGSQSSICLADGSSGQWNKQTSRCMQGN